MTKVTGIPHVAFLIRAAGPIGIPAARGLVRMCEEMGDDRAAQMLRDAIQRPLSDEERRRLTEPLNIEPSTK